MILGTPSHRRPALSGGTGTAPVSRAMPLLPTATHAAHRQPVLKNLHAPQQLSLDLQPRLR